MTIRDLFQFPTIEELASHLTPTVSIADQGPVEGNANLTPVQQRFFAYPGAFEHHYNQAVMLTSEKRLDETALRRAVSALIKHHDALRMMFKKTITDASFNIIAESVKRMRMDSALRP